MEHVWTAYARRGITSHQEKWAKINKHAKLPLFPFAVEVYVISDYSHTEGLRKMSLKPFEYMKTYMYKKNADYVSFTDAGDLDADGTVIKLRHYAGNSTSAQQSDLVILFTQLPHMKPL
ncbi:uncharacterized protein LOC119164558 isoform X5 [Rhipicephalus microplus]|uniref:uncharacterized protein LOC119164558 isoform X5 n=1 Tax=Rhipicephalus microplus TaxID=6941 RepID=UPI003F6A9280